MISVPELRQLEARKNSIGLTEQERERWSILYENIIRLFGQEHAGLAQQRAAFRIPIRLKVDYQINQEKFYSMSHDISINGIAVDFTHVIPLDAIAQMQLGIQFSTFLGLWKKKHIPVKAQVRWIDQKANRIGFQFIGVPYQFQEAIQKEIYSALNHKIHLSLKSSTTHARN